jgi:hypothetical protein
MSNGEEITINLAKRILDNNIELGTIMRGYLEFVRIKNAWQQAMNDRVIDTYVGVSVADNIISHLDDLRGENAPPVSNQSPTIDKLA